MKLPRIISTDTFFILLPSGKRAGPYNTKAEAEAAYHQEVSFWIADEFCRRIIALSSVRMSHQELAAMRVAVHNAIKAGEIETFSRLAHDIQHLLPPSP